MPLADGTTTEAVTYQARDGEVFVGFSYADGAAGDAAGAGGISSLRAAAEASARDTDGDLVLLEEVVVADRPAVRSRIVTPNGIVEAVSFVDGDRLYTVQAVAAAAPDGTPDLDPAVLDDVLATIALG